jgi:hypothetical protein
MASTARDSRLEFRLTSEEKAIIERAAALSGSNTTDRPDDDHDLALVNGEIYVLEDLEVPEELVDLAKLYEAHSVYVLPFFARCPGASGRE